MSQTPPESGPFDPFAAFKTMRETGMEAWSKAMIDMVNTEQFAQGMGAYLDNYLNVSAPLRKALHSTMTEVLTHLNMPTRTDVTSIAERLTNIEMRLDDLDARLDTLQPPAGAPRAPARKAK